MNRRTLVVAAALAVVVVAVGVFYALNRNAPGTTLLTSSPSPRPTVSPGPAEAVVPLPSAMWGDWHAEVDRLDGVTSVAQPIRASFSWEDGRSALVQLDGDGRQVFQSSPLSAPAGEIRLRANGNGLPCTAGDEGRYHWSRSSDGLFLTLELIEDACAPRGAALARTWVHSLSAVNDGGVGMVPGEPWIQVTLPKERFAMGGGTDAADIHSFDDSVSFKAMIVVKDPMGFRAPCEADQQPFVLKPDIRAYADYVRALPGMQLDEHQTTIDGLSALVFHVIVATEFPCSAPDGPGIFRSRDLTDAHATWGYGPGDTWYMATLVKDGSLYIFTWENHAGVEAAEAQAIFDSIRFSDKLPTP